MNTGKTIAELRTAANMSQQALADAQAYLQGVQAQIWSQSGKTAQGVPILE